MRALILIDHLDDVAPRLVRLRNRATAARLTAELALRTGVLAEAERHARLAIKLIGRDRGAERILAAALLARGASDEARRVHDSAEWSLAAGDFGRAAALAREDGWRRTAAGQTNPARAGWRATLATALGRAGRSAEAIEVAEDGLERARAFGAPTALAASLLARAVAEPDLEARVVYAAAAVEVPTPARLLQAEARIELGAALHRLGRVEEAGEPLRSGARDRVGRGCPAARRPRAPDARAHRAAGGRVSRRGLAIATACAGGFLAFLDTTIVNTAFPGIAASFPDASAGGPRVGPRRVLHRHRRAARAGGRDRRPDRAQARLPGRRRAVHRSPRPRAPPRPSLEALIAARVAAGRRSGRDHGRLARADPARVPGRAARVRGRAVGRVGRARRGVRPAARRRCWSSSTGAGCSSSTSRSASRSSSPAARRSSSTRRAVDRASRPARRRARRSPASGCSRSRSSRAARGAGRARACWARSPPRPSCSPRPRTAAAPTRARSSTRRCMRIGSFRRANLGLLLLGMAFFSTILANVLFLVGVWGYSVLTAGPGRRARRDRDRGRRRPGGQARRPLRPPRRDRPGLPALRRRHVDRAQRRDRARVPDDVAARRCSSTAPGSGSRSRRSPPRRCATSRRSTSAPRAPSPAPRASSAACSAPRCCSRVGAPITLAARRRRLPGQHAVGARRGRRRRDALRARAHLRGDRHRRARAGRAGGGVGGHRSCRTDSRPGSRDQRTDPCVRPGLGQRRGPTP